MPQPPPLPHGRTHYTILNYHVDRDCKNKLKTLSFCFIAQAIEMLPGSRTGSSPDSGILDLRNETVWPARIERTTTR